MARQMAYEQLRAEVAKWELPYLEFHIPRPAGPAKEFGQMMFVVEARRGAGVVDRYGITMPTVLTAKSLDVVVQDILTNMVQSWAESWLKRTETTPPVREGNKDGILKK